MTFEERLAAVCARMAGRNLDLILAAHDGAHFIETPNPVTVLSGFKSLGPAICLVDRAGATTLIVAPAWDAERARQICPKARVIGVGDVVEGLAAALPKSGKATIGSAGLAFLPFGIARRIAALLPEGYRGVYALPAPELSSDVSYPSQSIS